MKSAQFNPDQAIENNKNNDLLTALLNAYLSYTKTRRKAYQLFQRNFKHHCNPHFFTTMTMTMTMNIKQFALKLSHNAVAVALIGFVVFGSVSAFALEALLPLENKPSTLIQNVLHPEKSKNNNISVANPYIALVPNETHDVVASNFCDLAIKYPKQIDGTTLRLYRAIITNPKGESELITLGADESDTSYFVLPNITCSDYDPKTLTTQENRTVSSEAQLSTTKQAMSLLVSIKTAYLVAYLEMKVIKTLSYLDLALLSLSNHQLSISIKNLIQPLNSIE